MVPRDVQLGLQHFPLSQQLRIIPLFKSLNVQTFFARGQSACLRFFPDGDGCQGNSQHHLCILSRPQQPPRPLLSECALCVLGYRCPLRVICSLLSCCDRTAESRVWFYYCWSLGNFSQHIQEDWAQGYFCLNHQGERDLGSVPLGVIHKICIDIQLATLTPFLAKGEVCHPSYQYLRLNYLCWGRKRLPWLCC